MQSARRGDDLHAGAQKEVVGVAEDDLRAQLLKLGGRHRLYGGAGADGHENRGFDHAAAGGQASPARGAGGILFQKFKYSGLGFSDPGCSYSSMNIAA